jgi:PBSX family phage terminase large subunit
MDVKLSDVIAPSFYDLHKDVKQDKYTHYWLDGGRGSTKSSFAGAEIILGMMRNPGTNAVAIRKVGKFLKESVYEQLLWCIDKLGVTAYWDAKLSPLEITYIPTGQKILFRGADKPKKIKSTKVRHGYIRYIWFEEVDEFNGEEELRVINQSLMRGGSKFDVFYSYNPPKTVSAWVNNVKLNTRGDTVYHHSDYLSVPAEWLGEQFFIEAEELKAKNEALYNHEYLGEVTGTGGEVFTNVVVRPISDDEVKSFSNLKRGIDWGYAADPFSYGVMHYDKTRKRLYIFYEIYQVRLSNSKASELIKVENKLNQIITADSAEPKSIADLNERGHRIRGAKKGPDSIDHGMKFLSEEIEEIIIDKYRCPNTAREFTQYELEKDNNGNFKAGYPDKDNHTIDMVRYALEDDMKANRKVKVKSKANIGL